MQLPEIFKYGSLISVPLFGIIALTLIRQTDKAYSIRTHTISQSIKFLKKTHHLLIFRTNFFLKALLDLCFSLYVLNFFHLSATSPIGLALILSAVLFGSLAYFVESKNTAMHLFIVYTSGLLWAIGQTLLMLYIGDEFTVVSIAAIALPIVIGLGSLFLKKTNAYIQATCLLIWYAWLLFFVFHYL